jgi:hypothetical protein
MMGWLLVGPEGTGTAAGLKAWIDLARLRAEEPQKTTKKPAGVEPRRAEAALYGESLAQGGGTAIRDNR